MSQSEGNVPSPSEPQKPTTKKKRRGWWWKIPVLLLILLVLVVLLVPSIASTSPVRGIILGKVNASLPGKLAVDDWSLGWFSGAKVKGAEWTDATGKKIATVAEVDTPVTVMQLARGNLHLGEIVVKGVKADYVVPVGAAAPPPGTQAPAGSGTSGWPVFNLPDVTAKVRIEDISGQVTFAAPSGKSTALKLDGSTKVTVDLPGGGSPTTVDALIALAQPAGVGSVAVTANVNGVKAGSVDTKTLSGKSTLTLKQVDLDQFAAIMRAMGQDIALQGSLGGQVEIASAGGGAATAKGELSAAGVTVAMGKDRLQTQTLRIPVDAELTAGTTPRAIVRQVGVILDQAQVNVTADMPMSLVAELQTQGAITQEGKAHVDVQVPQLPVLVNSLRTTLGIQQDVQVTAGKFSAAVDMVSSKDGMHITAPISLSGVAGTQGTSKIGPLQPVTIDSSAKITSLKSSELMKNIGDVVMKISSSFMTVNATAPTLAQANAQGSLDLAKLKSDLGSIIDLSTVRGGSVTFNLASRQGATPNSYSTDLKVQGSDLAFDMPAQAGSPARRIESGTLLLTATSTYDNGKIALQSPLHLEVSAKESQQGANQKWSTVVDDGLQLVANGSADLNASPRTATVSQLMLTVGKQSPLVQLALPAGQSVQVVLSGERVVTTDARLKLSADLVALQKLSGQMSSAPTTQPLKRGAFVGDVVVSVAADGFVKAGIEGGNLDVDNPSPKFTDTLSVNVTAQVAGDNSTASAVANVKGKTAQVVVDASAGLGVVNGAQTLTSVNVSKLDVQNDFAQVSLVKPIIITDVPALTGLLSGGTLPANAQVGGELLVKADITKAMALAGPAQAGAATLAGTVTSHQVIALKQGAVVADLDTQIADLKVTQGGKVAVQEPKLSLAGQVNLTPASKTLEVNNLAVTSSTGMLDLKTNLRVTDLGNSNKIEKGDVQLTPDWAKLWPVVYAMLPPANQQKIGDITITGKDTSGFTLGGSYPMAQTDAIKHVTIAGQLHLPQVNWKTYGITASGVIPLQLQSGVLKFANAAGQPTPAPLTVNNGKVTLSDASIDLTSAITRLNITANSQLAQGIQLNTVLVASLGKYATVLFMDPTNASGTVDVKVISCTGLALGAVMYDPKDPGKAEFSISLHQLDIASKGTDLLFAAMQFTPAQGQDRITGEINDGRVSIAAGHCLQKLTLTLGNTPIGMNGDLRLSDNFYNPLDLTVPGAMVAGLLQSSGVRNAAQFAPQQVTVTFTGPANALKLDPKTVQNLATNTIKQQGTQALLGGLTGNKGGNTAQPQATPGATTQKSDVNTAVDILGGLLNKNKKK